MPGLLRGIARTAVIAGTATAVSNRVSRRQLNRWSRQEDQQNAQQQQQYPPPPPPQYYQQPPPQQQYYQPPPQQQQQYYQPPPPAPPRDTVTQLKELAELKSQGILTDAEFQAQKAKLLA